MSRGANCTICSKYFLKRRSTSVTCGSKPCAHAMAWRTKHQNVNREFDRKYGPRIARLEKVRQKLKIQQLQQAQQDFKQGKFNPTKAYFSQLPYNEKDAFPHANTFKRWRKEGFGPQPDAEGKYLYQEFIDFIFKSDLTHLPANKRRCLIDARRILLSRVIGDCDALIYKINYYLTHGHNDHPTTYYNRGP